MRIRTEDPRRNLELFREITYHGRGIVTGITPSGRYLDQIYFLEGRSENSRNRIFEYEGSWLRTAPADPSKVTDPSLIIYEAMLETRGRYIVSNGVQTKKACEVLRGGYMFRTAMDSFSYEPDAPNYTPRITSMFHLEHKAVVFSIIRRKSKDDDRPDRALYTYQNRDPRRELRPGVGYAVTTYEGDGDPLPSFHGGPYELPLYEDADEAIDTYWDSLSGNRVSIALKRIEISTGQSHIIAINQFDKVSA
ncbi:MAG TPA: IMP cyclohydrolase [Candidatus Paceibacterota bacterium]|jgi:IMP cyclohydrolase|nr:IMP cyclohydrolase [Candidatus Paceibacterota bacterium]